jgi:hypothetical protein
MDDRHRLPMLHGLSRSETVNGQVRSGHGLPLLVYCQLFACQFPSLRSPTSLPSPACIHQSSPYIKSELGDRNCFDHFWAHPSRHIPIQKTRRPVTACVGSRLLTQHRSGYRLLRQMPLHGRVIVSSTNRKLLPRIHIMQFMRQ